MEQQANAPPEARAIVNYLRNSSSIPLRNGLLGGTRYYYFHGTRAVSALLSPAYAKLAAKNKPPLPVPKTETEAEQILHGTLPFAFFLRVERGDRVVGAKKPDGSQPERMRELKIVQQQMFKKEMHYAWFYQGSQLRLQLMGLGMVALLLAGVMFPLWPPMMRLGVWYLSIGLLGLIGAFFVLAIIRLILWAASALVGKAFWLFPNLFADVGFVESFIPVWEWDLPPPPKKGVKGGKGAKATRAGPSEAEVKADALLADEGVQATSSSSSAAGAEKEGKASSAAAAEAPSAPPAAKPKRESDGLADLD